MLAGSWRREGPRTSRLWHAAHGYVLPACPPAARCQARKMLGRKAAVLMSIMLILYSFGAGALGRRSARLPLWSSLGLV